MMRDVGTPPHGDSVRHVSVQRFRFAAPCLRQHGHRSWLRGSFGLLRGRSGEHLVGHYRASRRLSRAAIESRNGGTPFIMAVLLDREQVSALRQDQRRGPWDRQLLCATEPAVPRRRERAAPARSAPATRAAARPNRNDPWLARSWRPPERAPIAGKAPAPPPPTRHSSPCARRAPRAAPGRSRPRPARPDARHIYRRPDRHPSRRS